MFVRSSLSRLYPASSSPAGGQLAPWILCFLTHILKHLFDSCFFRFLTRSLISEPSKRSAHWATERFGQIEKSHSVRLPFPVSSGELSDIPNLLMLEHIRSQKLMATMTTRSVSFICKTFVVPIRIYNPSEPIIKLNTLVCIFAEQKLPPFYMPNAERLVC